MNTDNKNKFLLGLALVFFIAMVIIVSLSFKNIPKGKEPEKNPETFTFNSNKTSNGILVLNDNGIISPFQTNNNSVLLIDSNGNLKNLGLPLGLVIPWTGGANIPNGWSLCDGTNNTPNLLNRFILGNSNNRAVGLTGGEETVLLKPENIPKHTHNITLDDTSFNLDYGTCGGGGTYASGSAYTSQTSTQTNGGDQPHENMPPYYVLRYICYTGIKNQPESKSFNKVVLADNNGNTQTYTTNNNSLLITDNSGNPNSLSFVQGMIMLWYNKSTLKPTAENIPSGWALCDGQTTVGNYTVPDLRSNFILGEGPGKQIGSTGGKKEVILTSNTIPNHTHNIRNASRGDDCFGSGGCAGASGLIGGNSYTRTSDSGTGSGTAHNNMPPYFVLSYICYVGNISDSYGSTSAQNLILSNTNGDLIPPYKLNNDSLILTDNSGILKNLPFPKGLIIAWYNVGITGLPPGWSLCDGNISNSGYQTPDLRGKFILGYDPRSSESVGPSSIGEEQVQLTIKNIPSHTHSSVGYPNRGYDGDPSNCYRTYTGNGARSTKREYAGTTEGGNVGDANGNALPHNNMPPYFVLCYICYTGDNL